MSGLGELLLVLAGIVLLITLWCAATLFADRPGFEPAASCAGVQQR